MADRYIVVTGEYTYPSDPISIRAIKDAGGVSQMTTEAKEKLKFKTVVAGQDCSDMPEPARSIYLERGWITRQETKPVKPVLKDGADQ